MQLNSESIMKIVLLLASILLLSGLNNSIKAQICTQLLKQHILFLTDVELEGRLTGSKGETIAAEYLQQQMAELLLEPIGKTMLHPFEFQYIKPNSSSEDSVSLIIKGNNVVAILNNNAEKTIVIGAHYDHLGRNERNKSLAPSNNYNYERIVHPGADDNASGVAGVLELARLLSTNNITEPSNYLFALFSGEEDGLIGSTKLAEQLIRDSIPIQLMINLDMIGRLDSLNSLYLGGVGTSPEFSVLSQLEKSTTLKLYTDSSGLGASDHNAFYLNNIPVLYFHTGAHTDYHKPSDTEEKINYTGMVTILDFIYSTIIALSEIENINFTKTKNSSISRVNMNVTLGIIPRHGITSQGLTIDAVLSERPAEQGGLQRGDTIVKIDDCVVTDIYSYMECLGKINKGDAVIVIYLRNNTLHSTTLKF